MMNNESQPIKEETNPWWQRLSAYTYLFICLFDFFIVPCWFGFSRATTDYDYEIFSKLDPSVQIRLIDSRTFQHQPFTLQGGGMFHIAFGALLTGSAVSSFRKKLS